MPNFNEDLQNFQGNSTTSAGGTQLPSFQQDLSTFQTPELPSVSDSERINLQTEQIKAQDRQRGLDLEQFDLELPETAEQSAVLNKTGEITQRFGQKSKYDVFSGGVNYGTDIAVPTGTQVATPSGEWEVVDVFDGANNDGFIGNKTNSGYGNSVLLRNPETGEMLRFSHLSPGIMLRPGQTVGGNQVFASTGSSGNVTGSHLDVEYYNNGRLADVEDSRYWGDFVGGSGGGNPQDFFKNLFEGAKNVASQVVDRGKDIIESQKAKSTAKKNLDEQLAESIRQKQRNQPGDPEIGFTSAKYSQLNPDEQRYIAQQAAVAIPGETLEEKANEGARFVKLLNDARKSKTAAKANPLWEQLDEIVRQQASPKELQQYGDKVGVALRDDDFVKTIARRIYNQAESERDLAFSLNKLRKTKLNSEQSTLGDIELYRGESNLNKGGRYYTPDKEFARQFTQTSADSEIKNLKLKQSDIYKPKQLPSATSEAEMLDAIKEAQDKGFKYMWVSEGKNQPDSVFNVEGYELPEMVGKLEQQLQKAIKGNETYKSLTGEDSSVIMKNIKKLQAQIDAQNTTQPLKEIVNRLTKVKK